MIVNARNRLWAILHKGGAKFGEEVQAWLSEEVRSALEDLANYRPEPAEGGQDDRSSA